MLGFPILYFKGTRLMMFQLSSFYCIGFRVYAEPPIPHPPLSVPKAEFMIKSPRKVHVA